MKINWMNTEIKDNCARVQFIAYDPITGKQRRPVIEFDSGDLCRMVEIAKDFRRHMRSRQAAFKARGDGITQSGVTE